MLDITNLNPFELEKLRAKYARSRNTKKFLNLYKRGLKEIPNKNNGHKWDNLNKVERPELEISPIYNDKLHIVTEFLRNKNGTVLDVGFANGIIEENIKGENLRLYGIDISKASVRRLKKRVKGQFMFGSILKIPFNSNYFDYVLALDILEHISPSKIFKSLGELERVMKKGGYLIVFVPLNEDLENMIKSNTNINSHVRIYTPEVLKAELSSFNFSVVKEYLLYAFRTNYFIKKVIVNLAPFKLRNPNEYILICKKK